MKIFLEGWGFIVKDLTANDVRSLRRMINSANLNERRDFDDLKKQIDDLEKKGLIPK